MVERKRVVVIGGGFAGSQVARSLANDFDVTLIDTKDYFEFTPSVLRTIVEPDHITKIQSLHASYLKKARIVHGEVSQITREYVQVDKTRLAYDYLVIATGSRYNSPIKEKNLIPSARAQELRLYYDHLCQAKKVLIIGGGYVGVELAGEIVDHYRGKEVVICQSDGRLLSRNTPNVSASVEKFLNKRGVRIIYNERIVKSHNREFISDKGTTLQADLAFLCVGIVPNSEVVQKSFPDALIDRGHVKVNEYLQVSGFQNIFAAGDVTSINEEKTAQNAEKQALIVAKNIRRLENHQPLVVYSSDPRLMVISLGRYYGILTYKNYSWAGLIPGLLKSVIEWREMRKFR